MTPPDITTRVEGAGELPQAVLDQLSALPEDRPDDFTCAICVEQASNRWNHSPKDYERPPICKCCETITGWRWNGGAYRRTPPKGGSFRDRRNAMRIDALADALAKEARK